MLTTPVSKSYALASLLLRLALAAVFIYHGVDKIFGPINKWGLNDWGATWATNMWQRIGQPPQDLTRHIVAMKHDTQEERDKQNDLQTKVNDLYREEGKKELPPPILGTAAQFAVAWGELVGGIAMLFGVLTRLAALGLIIIQIGAIATVTWFQGFATESGSGYEFNVVLLAVCLALLLMGGGMLSIDHWLVSGKEQQTQQQTQPTQPPMSTPAPTGV